MQAWLPSHDWDHGVPALVILWGAMSNPARACAVCAGGRQPGSFCNNEDWLRTTAQDGEYATKYPNVLDLRSGDIFVVHPPQRAEPGKLNLTLELPLNIITSWAKFRRRSTAFASVSKNLVGAVAIGAFREHALLGSSGQDALPALPRF
jgi:hypothetical protein